MTFDFWNILYAIDIILFLPAAGTVLYLTLFAAASLINRHTEIPVSKTQNRFIVIIPSYKNDAVIEQTVKSLLGQTYPQRLFDVTVVSDHQDEVTNFKLAQYPVTLLTPNFSHSTKGRALQLAINNLPQFKIYDLVVIIDAGNIVGPDFLQQLNDAYECAGTKAIQVHRVSKNRDTAIANLDAIFEEINNSIFRRGHITLNLSSAITGSGIVFDFKWFKENIVNVKTAWEDKELEAMLMRQRIYVDYFDDILVYDEKTRHTADFNQQRSRWAKTQLRTILSNIKYLPGAIFSKNYDHADKIIQWLLIPRTILVGIVALMSITLPVIYTSLAIKWWILAVWMMFVFALATPNYLVDDKWDKSFIKAPFIILWSYVSIFKAAKVDKLPFEDKIKDMKNAFNHIKGVEKRK